MPAITGDTANGRSIRVISRFLPGKLELGDRPGRGQAEDQVERHGDRRDQQRQPDRAEGVGLGRWPPVDAARPWRTPRRRPATSGSSQEERQEREGQAIRVQRTSAGSPVGRAMASGRRSGAADGTAMLRHGLRPPCGARRPGLQQVDQQQQRTRRPASRNAMAVAPA